MYIYIKRFRSKPGAESNTKARVAQLHAENLAKDTTILELIQYADQFWWRRIIPKSADLCSRKYAENVQRAKREESTRQRESRWGRS